jgi:hypothetical protein
MVCSRAEATTMGVFRDMFHTVRVRVHEHPNVVTTLGAILVFLLLVHLVVSRAANGIY